MNPPRREPPSFPGSSSATLLRTQAVSNRQHRRRLRLGLSLLLALFVLAEVLLGTSQALSIWLWGGITLYALSHLVWTQGELSPSYLAFGLLAATRLLNFAVSDLGAMWASGVLGLSLALGTLSAFRHLGNDLARLGSRGSPAVFQILVASSGLLLGYLVYLLAPVGSAPTGWALVGAAGVALVTAAGEELFFRVFLIRALAPLLTPLWAALYAGGLYGAMHLYWSGPLGSLLALEVGLFFSWSVVRSRSYAGVLAAHVLMNLLSTVILPRLLG